MAESFSREKLRHALQKEGGREILCDLPPVRPRLVRPLMSRMNGKKTQKTHTHIEAINSNKQITAERGDDVGESGNSRIALAGL